MALKLNEISCLLHRFKSFQIDHCQDGFNLSVYKNISESRRQQFESSLITSDEKYGFLPGEMQKGALCTPRTRRRSGSRELKKVGTMNLYNNITVIICDNRGEFSSAIQFLI